MGELLEGVRLAGTAAVVVTYNSEDVIESCVSALRQFAPGVRVLVVDNASTDRTVERARAAGAEAIANGENRGFAGGVNQGFRATDSELVLILNPDVRLGSEISHLEAAARKHGVAGGVLTNETGRAQAGFTIRRFPNATVLSLELLGVNRVWPGNPWNRRYRYLDRDLEKPGRVEQPAGAFLMVRRDVWSKLGGLDERFHPIWFEDVDFCRRAVAAGYEIQYVPEARAFHLGGHSIDGIDRTSRQVQWYDSLLRYAGKHFRRGPYCAVCLAGALGALPRMIVGTIQERSLRPITSCIRILQVVGRRLVSRPPSGQAQRPGSEY